MVRWMNWFVNGHKYEHTREKLKDGPPVQWWICHRSQDRKRFCAERQVERYPTPRPNWTIWKRPLWTARMSLGFQEAKRSYSKNGQANRTNWWFYSLCLLQVLSPLCPLAYEGDLNKFFHKHTSKHVKSIRLAASGWLIKGIDEVLQTHRQTDAQTNRQTDVQTNRQTETQWRWKTLGSNKMQERVKGWNVTSFMRIFSRGHATLHHGLSDCSSVGPSVHLSVFPCIGPSLRLSVHHNFELRVI